jgi:hypothetical protein
LLAYQYVQLSRVLNRSQYTIAEVEFRRNRLSALWNEAVLYSQRDPSMKPLLESLAAKRTVPADQPPSR